MDADEKANIDERLTQIEARARLQKRRSALWTLAPVVIVGVIVIVLANAFAEKMFDLSALDQKANELRAQVDKQERELEEKRQERDRIKAEKESLEERKTSLEQFLKALTPRRGEKERVVESAGVEAPQSVVVSDDGATQSPFQSKARALVEPGSASPGAARSVFNVTLALDVHESEKALIKSVTYDLDKNFYKKNQFESDVGPTYEVTFPVYECLGIVLATVHLTNDATASVMIDWCRDERWPVTAKNASAPDPPRPGGPRGLNPTRKPPATVPEPR
jgi:hypothetical protein